MTGVAHDHRRQRPPDQAALSTIVERCRRRARRVVFVRSLAIVLAAGFTGLGAVRVAWAGPVLLPAALVAVIGVLCAAASALRFTPSIRQVAGRIDRCMRLEDAVVAAIQAQSSEAAVAPLIVRQAVSRARDVDANAIFPLEMRRPAALLIGAMLVMAVATLARHEHPMPVNRQPIASGGQVGAAGPAGAGERAASASSAREARSAGATGRARGAAAAASSPEQSAAGQSDGNRRRADAQAANAETPEEAGAAGSTTRDADASAQSEQRGSGRATGGGAGSPRGSSAEAKTSARGDFAGAGAAGSAARSLGAGSGGVRGGALIDARQDLQSTASRSTAPPTRPAWMLQQARQRAEAALMRGDIPPEMRPYVREYFRAITP